MYAINTRYYLCAELRKFPSLLYICSFAIPDYQRNVSSLACSNGVNLTYKSQ